jgi:hypothetical protein
VAARHRPLERRAPAHGCDTARVSTDDESPICSAKGCTDSARWVLAWNNPKLHTPDRRKTWMACDEHRVTLGEFLGARGFLKEVTAVESPATE